MARLSPACPGGHREAQGRFDAFARRWGRMPLGSPSPGQATGGERCWGAKSPEPVGRARGTQRSLLLHGRHGVERAAAAQPSAGARAPRSSLIPDRGLSRRAFGPPRSDGAGCRQGKSPNTCKIAEKSGGGVKRD
jgi:hypothetical protein